MIIVIRIAGKCNLKKDVENTFKRLKMEKKYSSILVDESDAVRIGMIKVLKNYVTFGKIEEGMLVKLKEKRDKGKSVFFLHPPRGGFKKSTKLAYPKGVLGENNEINKLIERML